MSRPTTLLLVGVLLLVVAGTFGLTVMNQNAARLAADIKAGIVPEERELAKQLAMEQVHFYLGEKEPLFNEPRAEYIGSRGKYYKIQGKVRAFLGKDERWVHNYWVEIRLDSRVRGGFVCHSVYVGGQSLHSNPYIDKRR